MNNKSVTKHFFLSFLMLLFLLFLSFICPAFGEEDIRKSEIFTEKQLQEILSSAPPTQPDVLEKFMENEVKTLSVSGSIPYLEGEASYDWWLSISSVAESIHQDKAFGKYLHANGGPIIGYGPRCDGYIQISVNHKMKGKVTSQDIQNMNQIVEKYAEAEGIEDMPIVITYSGTYGDTAPQSSIRDITPPSSSGKNGPVQQVSGGYVSATPLINNDAQFHAGTFSFAVQQNDNSSAKGMVTVAHLINFDAERPVYVNNISSGNLLGYAVDTHDDIDAIYVPYDNATPALYVGNDSAAQTFLQKIRGQGATMDVYAGVDAVYGYPLNRYGDSTNNTAGNLVGFDYDNVWRIKDMDSDPDNPVYVTRVYDKVGYLNGSVSQKGDSGGPVYYGMNVTENNTTSYQALVLGMHIGSDSLNSERVCVFVPFREIQDKFDVTILTN